MAESWKLRLNARELLVSSSHEGLATVVKHLFTRQESNEYQTARVFYDFLVSDFPNCLIRKLLKVYRYSPNGVVRFQSIYLLSVTLADIRKCKFKLSLDILYEIKPLLISCLTMQDTKESDIKILRRIVSSVAYNVVMLNNNRWDELSDCIHKFAETEPVKAFHLFIDLPLIYEDFVNRFVLTILEKADKFLVDHKHDSVEDWSLGLETIVKVGVQIPETENSLDLIENIRSIVEELVEKGMEAFLEKGLEELEKFLSRDANLCRYNKEQRAFVGKVVFNVAVCYKTVEDAERVASKILRVVEKPEECNHDDHGLGFERDWDDYLKNLSSLEILRIFASRSLVDTSRELAIRRLNVLLSDHISKKVEINVSEMRQLQPLIISCLEEEGISDSMFRVLGEVVNHVAYDVLILQDDDAWDGLRDYIVSQSKTEFQKAVYIFQCLTMKLDGKEFMHPAIVNLLAEIHRRLKPSTELLVDNSCWVLAFVGGFCSSVHLIDNKDHAEAVKEITYKMIDSVRELVEKSMEVGFVRRAFRDMERLVKAQMKWYRSGQYKFVKGLLWRLYAIKGMKMESKTVLWRINVQLERDVNESIKVIPRSELDWLNPPKNTTDIIESEELAIVVEQLFKRQESEEYQTAHALYDFFVSDSPNRLIPKLLQVYQSSSNGVIRFQSIYLLSETLADFRDRSFELSVDALHEIKPLLISCLKLQHTKESDIKILRRIVSFVAYNVLKLNHGKWDELGDCILWLANKERPFMAFHVFLHLPLLYKEFIEKFSKVMLEKAMTFLLNPEHSGHWSLALGAVFKLGIQFLDTEVKRKWIKKYQLSNIVNSAKELVDSGKEQFLVGGLEDFERFLSRDTNLYQYDESHCEFVSTFMNKIGKVGTEQTKEIVRKINMLVTEPPLKDHGAEFYRDWYDHLENLSSLQVLEIFALSDLEDRSRDIAIRRLSVLLSDHTSETVPIDISEMRKLQPLLISCLKEEGVSDSMFKVLGQVVNHVAYEMFKHQDVAWNDLRDYIASQSKEKFERAVYVFQCLKMALEDDEFVTNVLQNLLPEISKRLNPPIEVLIDNSGWVLAFTGAFCAIIHSIDMQNDVESVHEIAHKMVDSVKKLVERRMEVGLVRRAFRDMESIVKNQLKWYSSSEYKFLKGLLWRLYAIKGMKWESKVVLWRINVILERRVNKEDKEIPAEDEFDWLNLTTSEIEN